MKKIFSRFIIGIGSLLCFSFTFQAYLNWKIDGEKAMVKFSMKAHGQELIGNFKGAEGNIRFNVDDLANATLNCDIDVSTINTGIPDRDKHLLAKDFFDAKNAPKANFTSTSFEKTQEGYSVTGKLTIKATTLEIKIPFVFTGSADAGLFKGAFPIKRSDFKIGDEDEDISDKVTIMLEIPVTKAD